jgi:hypothetical protein
MRKVSTFLISIMMISGVAVAQKAPIVVGPERTSQSVPASSAEPQVIKPDAPAPGLSSFILQVCSATAGCETVSVNNLQTTLTHGGSYIDAYVWEVGYGSGEVATMSGNQLSSSYLVAKTPFCQQGNQYVIPCPNGYTVAGFQYEWNVTTYVETYSSPNFVASDTSINSPYNQVSR